MKRGDVALSELLKSINLKVDSLTKQVESLTLELKFAKEENSALKRCNRYTILSIQSS